MKGVSTPHHVARKGGGYIWHAVPTGSMTALCGISAGPGRKTRGKWLCIKQEYRDRYGVTCPTCVERGRVRIPLD